MYRFVPATCDSHRSIETLASAIRDKMASFEVLGTVILAPEGLNATVAGDNDKVESFVRYLRTDAEVFGGLSDLEPQYSFCPEMPFSQVVVKVRPEIVTMRKPGAEPIAQVGTYVPASEWNALIDDPRVLVIDARNDFEVRLGTFVSSGGKPAINPETGSFAEFPAFVERELEGMQGRTLALFCTGGIRCERATSYLLSLGFSDVRHLKGGVLSYLKATHPDDSRWNGGCFVFDGRVTLGHGLVPGYAL